jgi:hypothetical protein
VRLTNHAPGAHEPDDQLADDQQAQHKSGTGRPLFSRKIIIAAISIASVAGGGVLVHALSGPSRLSLSASSDTAQQKMAAKHKMAGHGMAAQHMSQPMHRNAMRHFVFSTLNNSNDATFNQLLGINNRGQIAGYFGSGAKGHPNKGYLLVLSRNGSHFVNENFPGAKQTQVTGLNDAGVTVGFYSKQNKASQMNNNFGFYTRGGHFHAVNFPAIHHSTPPVNQLLGVNDSDVAVGFYTDRKGNSHGYTYNIITHRFHRVMVRDGVSTTAAAINNHGDIAGFRTGMRGTTKAFLRSPNGHLTVLQYPGSSSTMAFGVNDSGEVVGTYTKGSGNNAKSFGFTWSRHNGWRSISDPMGKGTTLVNGVNDLGDLVGFYTDAKGNTDGFLWAAGMHSVGMAPPVTATPSMMPTMMPTMSPTAMPTMPTTSPTMPTATPTVVATPTSSAPPGGPF